MIDRCRTQGMWDALESRIEEFLDSMSLQDLFEERRQVREQVREEVGA
jgi:DNA-binding IscR family transcriptional regulator